MNWCVAIILLTTALNDFNKSLTLSIILLQNLCYGHELYLALCGSDFHLMDELVGEKSINLQLIRQQNIIETWQWALLVWARKQPPRHLLLEHSCYLIG